MVRRSPLALGVTTAVLLGGLAVLDALVAPATHAAVGSGGAEAAALNVSAVPGLQSSGALAIVDGPTFVGRTNNDPNLPYTVLDENFAPVADVATPYVTRDGGAVFDGAAVRSIPSGPTVTLQPLPTGYSFDAQVGVALNEDGSVVLRGASRNPAPDRTVFVSFAAGPVADLRSLLADGTPDAELIEPSISRDGAHIAVVELTGGIGCSPGPSCTSQVVYARLDPTRVEIVSATPAGAPSAGRSWAPQISDDGRFVMFLSDATDLVADVVPSGVGLYRRDLVSDTTILLADDVTSSTLVPFSMTGDGQRAAYVSDVDGPEQIRMLDVGAASTPLLVSDPGSPGCSHLPALSSRGNLLLYSHCGGTTIDPPGAPGPGGVELAFVGFPSGFLRLIVGLIFRAFDTRLLGRIFEPKSVRRIRVDGSSNVSKVAATTTRLSAAALNVTVTNPQESGFLTVWPCDKPQPNASNVNYVAGQTVPNAVLTGVSANGEVCIYTHAATDVVIDVAGTFQEGSSYAAIAPQRVLDTRASEDAGTPPQAGAGSVTTLQVRDNTGLPSNTTAVSLNVTVTKPSGPGFVTVYPCSAERPTASNLNYVAGQTVPNAVVVPVAADGTVCLYTHAAADLIVDVNGAFTEGSGFHGVTPERLLDSRAGDTDTTPNLADGSVVTVPVVGHAGIPAGATTAFLNVTATNPTGAGFVTVYPCDAERPTASNLNYVAGQTVPNMVMTKLSANGEVCLYSKTATDLIVDVSGYITA